VTQTTAAPRGRAPLTPPGDGAAPDTSRAPGPATDASDRAGGRRWSLRARLSLLFAVAGVVVVAVTAVSVVSIVHLTDTRRDLLGSIDPASIQADRLFQAYLDEETGVRGYLLTRNTAFLQPYLDGAHVQRDASAQLQTLLRGHPDLQRQATEAQQAATGWGVDFALPTVLATRNGNLPYAESQLLGPGKARFDTVRARFGALQAGLAVERAATGQALSTATTQLLVLLGTGLAVILLAGVVVARSLRRWVVAPLATLGGSVRRVAGGELTRPVEPSGPPEIEALGVDVEAMRRRIVRELDDVASARADLAERNADLQRSNEELEQFAYVASHDLQEPLRKVTSFVQLLEQRYGGQLDERADEYIGFAVDGARRMQDLISDLLDFSRVGRRTEVFSPVDLGAAAADAVDALAPLLTEAAATVHLGRLPTVPGDRTLLVSLFQNLVANAVKFRGDAAPVVSVSARPVPSGWEVSVSDNGIGIEPRFADRVFVIFQRLHGRDTYDGTGIGLALCKKIVEFHGGTIRVDTGYTGGARLCFVLPDGREGRAAWPVDGTAPPSNC
jgi:signal transduction histidine kinase